MARGFGFALGACAVAALAAPPRTPLPSPVPELTLEELPRLAALPPEKGLVVPSQVLGWRQEAARLEHGDGATERDEARAAELYCRAARYGDAESQFALGWMLTNARGIERNDAQAAHLFAAAAEQGHAQAVNMAQRLGTPLGEPPPCLRPPDEDAAPPPAVAQRGRGAAAVRPGAPPVLPANAPEPIVRFVTMVAPEYQLDPHLVLAVIAAESNFNPWAVSPKDARGLMQLIPDTARRFQVRNIMDPTQNIRGGMAYLRWLLAYFQGDVALALAGYNAGEGAVDRYRGVPPYAETQMYVRKIVAMIGGRRGHPYDPRVVEPSPRLVGLRLPMGPAIGTPGAAGWPSARPPR